ncbi:hypothetical protein Efla_004373 [Eimeria flavescens]
MRRPATPVNPDEHEEPFDRGKQSKNSFCLSIPSILASSSWGHAASLQASVISRLIEYRISRRQPTNYRYEKERAELSILLEGHTQAHQPNAVAGTTMTEQLFGTP